MEGWAGLRNEALSKSLAHNFMVWQSGLGQFINKVTDSDGEHV